ncbi:hypothetical protein F0562_029704 [Nyssa sinensis]|uniref:Uncharacterized protein n=1 Tax=Nyssa sinensis TaxID=561372 RepID=A0A5J5B4R6_9ASTE|nr:hypothetical protein F0562_029704 [Nyssa sinensis]
MNQRRIGSGCDFSAQGRKRVNFLSEGELQGSMELGTKYATPTERECDLDNRTSRWASDEEMVQLDSQLEEIDILERKRIQLEVELHALEKKKDKASIARLTEVRKELDDLKDKLQPLIKKYRKEKERINELHQLK